MSLSRRSWRIAWSVCGALVLHVWLDRASADSDPSKGTKAHLLWSLPSANSCPTAPMIEREVEELSGRRVFVPAAQADVIVRGGLREDADGVRGWLEARAADGTIVGTRELQNEAGDCVSLQHTLALVLAILLDRPPRVTAARTEDTSPARAPRTPLALYGSASLGMLSGTLPRVTPGLGLSLELALTKSLRVRGDGSYWLPVERDPASGVGAKFSAYSGGLALCPRWTLPLPALSMIACGGAQLGAISATPRGLDGPGRLTRLMAQATLELGLAWQVRPQTRVFLSAGSAIALTRPAFFYDRADGTTPSVHRPAGAGVIARLGLTIGRP